MEVQKYIKLASEYTKLLEQLEIPNLSDITKDEFQRMVGLEQAKQKFIDSTKGFLTAAKAFNIGDKLSQKTKDYISQKIISPLEYQFRDTLCNAESPRTKFYNQQIFSRINEAAQYGKEIELINLDPHVNLDLTIESYDEANYNNRISPNNNTENGIDKQEIPMTPSQICQKMLEIMTPEDIYKLVDKISSESNYLTDKRFFNIPKLTCIESDLSQKLDLQFDSLNLGAITSTIMEVFRQKLGKVDSPIRDKAILFLTPIIWDQTFENLDLGNQEVIIFSCQKECLLTKLSGFKGEMYLDIRKDRDGCDSQLLVTQNCNLTVHLDKDIHQKTVVRVDSNNSNINFVVDDKYINEQHPIKLEIHNLDNSSIDFRSKNSEHIAIDFLQSEKNGKKHYTNVVNSKINASCVNLSNVKLKNSIIEAEELWVSDSDVAMIYPGSILAFTKLEGQKKVKNQYLTYLFTHGLIYDKSIYKGFLGYAKLGEHVSMANKMVELGYKPKTHGYAGVIFQEYPMDEQKPSEPINSDSFNERPYINPAKLLKK